MNLSSFEKLVVTALEKPAFAKEIEKVTKAYQDDQSAEALDTFKAELRRLCQENDMPNDDSELDLIVGIITEIDFEEISKLTEALGEPIGPS